jgi:hypothetical protein
MGPSCQKTGCGPLLAAPDGTTVDKSGCTIPPCPTGLGGSVICPLPVTLDTSGCVGPSCEAGQCGTAVCSAAWYHRRHHWLRRLCFQIKYVSRLYLLQRQWMLQIQLAGTHFLGGPDEARRFCVLLNLATVATVACTIYPCLVMTVFIPHYGTGHSPADSQGICHRYSKLSYMRRADL